MADNYTEQLWSAVDEGDVDTVKEILTPENAIERDEEQSSLLHVACLSDCETEAKGKIVALLVKFGADIEASDNEGRTPLYCACTKDQLPIVKLLVKKGASVQCADSNGNTALHVACENNFGKLTRYLIAQGADRSASNNEGYNPYDVADFAIKIAFDESNAEEEAEEEEEYDFEDDEIDANGVDLTGDLNVDEDYGAAGLDGITDEADLFNGVSTDDVGDESKGLGEDLGADIDGEFEGAVGEVDDVTGDGEVDYLFAGDATGDQGGDEAEIKELYESLLPKRKASQNDGVPAKRQKT
eukprot:Colp12_sorted_trinity150504_noHs@15321